MLDAKVSNDILKYHDSRKSVYESTDDQMQKSASGSQIVTREEKIG